MKFNFINKFREYLRVLKVAKKPDRDELFSTLKICAIGISIIGFIGFVIYLISVYLTNIGIL